MKRLAYTLALLYPLVATGQRISISATSGFASYKMSDLREFASVYNTVSDLPFRVVHDFPSRFFLGCELGARVSNGWQAGLSYEFHSTGGRLHYRDYSGHVLMDQVLRLNHFAVFVRRQLNSDKKNLMFLSVSFSKNVTRLTITEEILIGTANQSNTTEFNSAPIGMRPSFVFQKFLGRFFIQSSVGYEVVFSDALTLEDRNNVSLQFAAGKNASAGWTGIRLAAGIGLQLGK